MGGSDTEGDGLRYRAFVSYSRADRDVAKALQTSLERYVLPHASRFVKPGLRHERRPLKPVFRDEDELVPGHDLPARIQAGLRGSEYLLVICSPAAAASEWVDREIREFCALPGKADNVLAIAVAGQPNAQARGLDASLECLPRALRYQLEADGAGGLTPSDRPAEPLWVDWREPARNDRRAFLRIVAGLLSLSSLDELIRRDAQDRRRRTSGRAAMILAAALMLVALVAGSFRLRDELQQRHANEALAGTDALIAELMYSRAIPLALADLPPSWATSHAAVYKQLVANLELALGRNRLERSLFGPPLEAEQIAFDTDGRRILAVSPNGELRIWDVRTGDGGRLHRLGAPVCCSAFDANGSAVVVGTTDGTVRRLDLTTLRATAIGPHRCLGAPVASAWLDGSARGWVLTAAGARVCVLDARTLQTQAAFKLGDEDIKAIAACSPGNWLAVLHDDAQVEISSLQGARRAALPALAGITQMRASPRCTRLAIVAQGRLWLWDMTSPRPRLVASLAQPSGFSIKTVAFDLSDARLATTAIGDRQAAVWNARTGKLAAVVSHPAEVRTAIFSPTGAEVVTAGFGDWVQVSDAATGAVIDGDFVLRDRAAFTSGVAMSPDGTRLATTAGYVPGEPLIRIWNIASRPTALTAATAPVRSAVFSNAGGRIATASMDGVARLWDAKTFSPVAGAPEMKHGGPIYHLAWSRADDRIATASADGTGRVWDLKTGRSIVLPAMSGNEAVYVAFDPPGRRVVLASRNPALARGGWQVFDAMTGRPLSAPVVSARIWSAEFDPSGRSILTASQDHTLALWDAASGRLERRFGGAPNAGHLDSVNSANFAHQHRWIVSASDDGTARIWDAATGAPIGAPLDATSARDKNVEVLEAVFSPDDKQVLLVTSDGRLQAWDALTQRLLSIRLFPDQHGKDQIIYSLAFDRDGQRIVLALQDGTVPVVPAESDPRVVVRQAAALANRFRAPAAAR